MDSALDALHSRTIDDQALESFCHELLAVNTISPNWQVVLECLRSCTYLDINTAALHVSAARSAALCARERAGDLPEIVVEGLEGLL